jgi:hypothetical protein
MYKIPFAQGDILVDCSWRSLDPDKFDIDSMEWAVGITIPKAVWWNLHLRPEQMDPITSKHMYAARGDGAYIHEYIFEWLCNNVLLEYDGIEW